MATQNRRWVFTLNNYTPEEECGVQTWVSACGARYVVYGRERGESDTPHLQGYAVFSGMKRLTAMKALPGGSRMHFEIARGTNEQARDYCKKDGDVWEAGDMPLPSGKAEQQRWKDAVSAAKNGKFEDVPDDIFMRYYRTLKEIRKDHMSKPDDAPSVTGVWIWGPPGTGKSHKARADYPGAYLKMQNKWWDGYQEEKYVILDDFDSKELGHHLKIWCDKYSFLAETKGGAVHIRPEKIIITSNYSPKGLGWDSEMEAAITRRCEVIHMPTLFQV